MPTEIPLVMHAAYADLLDRAAGAAFDEAFAEQGGFVSKTVKGRKYWYFQVTENGAQVQRYVGPETLELLKRIEAHRAARDDEKDRRAIVSMLVRSAGLPAPEPLSGEIIHALQRAGVFRLRGVLVGTMAYHCYPAMLGVRLPISLVRTGDVDIAMDRNIAIALSDQTVPVIDALKTVDPSFRPVPHIIDRASATSYETKGRGVRVDFLTPNYRPNSDSPERLAPLGVHAQPLRFLDFLIKDAVPALLLHGAGVPVTVPAPERYALHKLIISQRRAGGAEKRGKDILQAEALLEILIEKRVQDLQLAWADVVARGEKWRKLLGDGAALLTPEIRDRLLKTAGVPRSFVPTMDIRFSAPPLRYDFDRDVVWFEGAALGGAHRVAVSGEALEDHFQASSSEAKDRVEAVRGNRSEIERLVRQKFLNSTIIGVNETVLLSEDVRAPRNRPGPNR